MGINEVAVRIKTHTLLTNSLFYPLSRSLRIKLGKLSQSFRSIFTRLPLVGKSIVFLLLITAIELIFLFACQQNFTLLMICWIMEKFFLVPVIIYISICLQTLQKAGNAIASGDLSYKTNTDYLILDFKEYAIQLNNIGVGMSAAVEKRLQSERMKTELITNISHDIKTPITSLINYAGLIASTPCDSPVHAEYAEVLTRKSERLKHLLEDLVEISKATSGNLELELLPCKADILLSQAAGEYETRLQDANLTLILQQPDEELSILADSKRIWRIFDNLLNNVAKYAMPGTRVFLSLEKREGNAVFTLRNISRDQLTVSPQELLERFTRGESSRTTDGNGLGLSIVSTLTERMGGTMQLDIDGDLFKVTLSFPLHQETEE
ncbi:MAG: HAMP domain-containing histidine kinase [Clostridia bacterium]|nr:HAMP domain-containing histidine kinase [Clostridia bacterium]